MSFKHRSNRHKYLSTTQTVDELHKNYMSKINDKRSSLPLKKSQLEDLQEELRICETLDFFDPIVLKKKSQLKSKINELKLEISKIENNSEIMDYISTTGNILVMYYTEGKTQYNTADDEENCDITETEQSRGGIKGTKTVNFSEVLEKSKTESSENVKPVVIDRLQELQLKSQQLRKTKTPVKKRKPKYQETSSNSIMRYFVGQERPPERSTNGTEKKPNVNKALLQEKYLYLTDKGYACGKSKISKTVYCTNCNVEKYQGDGCYVCKECGETEHILIEHEATAAKDSGEKQQKYPYKKVNHLKEKLNQFQSKESSDVPDEVCKIVIRDLKKKRIDPKKCVPPDVMSILKKHRFTGSYEHLQQIYCKISGANPISLSRETEEKIIHMFQSMQDSFHKHCPETRSNFLNYSYVLNKLFRILKMEAHSKFFSLLKSKDKLRDQDIIWSKVCKDMDWQFYSSF